MGEYIRSGTQIRDFWPDDDENTLHLSSDSWTTMREIMDHIFNKWGDGVKLENLAIEAKHIHTHCLGYDQYDGGDYTNFIVITRT